MSLRHLPLRQISEAVMRLQIVVRHLVALLGATQHPVRGFDAIGRDARAGV